MNQVSLLDLSTVASGAVIRVEPHTALVAYADRTDAPVSARFDVAAGATLFVRSFVRPGASVDLEAALSGDGATADIRAVAVAESGTASYASKTVSTASNTRASSEVSAFALSNGELSVTTRAEIGAGVSAASAEAVQSNVLFGAGAKVRGVPELKIASDDVKARHSCSVERFSDEKLFYLRSRGMSRHDATVMLVASKVSKAFSGLPSEAEGIGESLCSGAIRSIVGE